jgi:hypothetical protein
MLFYFAYKYLDYLTENIYITFYSSFLQVTVDRVYINNQFSDQSCDIKFCRYSTLNPTKVEISPCARQRIMTVRVPIDYLVHGKHYPADDYRVASTVLSIESHS